MMASNELQYLEAIDSIVHKSVKTNHPGLGVGIIRNGEVIYEKYRGLSNLQHQIPFSNKTRFSSSGMSPSLTSITAATFVAVGITSFDD